MALKVRKLTDPLVFALVSLFNKKLKSDSDTLMTYPHYDKTSDATSGPGDYMLPTSSPHIVTAADGDGAAIAKSRTLAIDLWEVYQRHLADALDTDEYGAGAHKTADAAPALTAPTSTTSLADLETFADGLYTDYNTHRASGTYHLAADATNVANTPAATTQGSLDTRMNDLKVQLNAHIAYAPASPMLRVTAA